MLRILLGNTLPDLRDTMLKQTTENARDGHAGQLILVPEQFSHEIERRLCAMGGDTICRFAEVLSFSRLAARVSTLYGGVSHKTLDKGGRLIAMSMALETVSSRLKLYGSGGKKPDLLLKLLALVEELKGNLISAAHLRRAAARLEGRLALKLEELALILESYDTVCARLGRDPRDRLGILCGQLRDFDYAQARKIWVFGFSDFTGQELAVLQALTEQAETVCVGLLGGDEDCGAFFLPMQTVRQLQQMAQAAQCAAQVEIVTEPGAQSPTLLHLLRYLFSGQTPRYEAPTDDLILHRSARIYSACLDVAGKLRALAMAGHRYRDMAVCCTQLTEYQPVLASVLEKFSIPAYYAGSRDILTEPVIGMTLAALEAAAGGMETEDVLRFLKSGLSPISLEECDRIERYVQTWRIRGRNWDSVWDMHPDGYGAQLDDVTAQTLQALNDLRIRAVGALLTLRKQLSAAADTGTQVLAFYDFLEKIGLAKTLEALQTQAGTDEALQQAQTYAQLYEIMIGAMEQLYHVLGKTVRTAEDFSRLFTALLSQYEIGTIPANLDSVQVGDLASMRFSQEPFLFILGADDGAFPAYQSDAGLLTEQERLRLQSLGLPVAGVRDDGMNRELTGIYQVLSGCSEKLYVNHCAEQPSHLVERMETLFPALSWQADADIPEILLSDEASIGVLLARMGGGPLNALPQATGVARALKNSAGYTLGALPREAVERLYGKTLYLSASRIDQYAACRCSYFFNYGLKLKRSKPAAFDAPIYGTFVHAVLEQTAKQVAEEGGFRTVTEPRLTEIARETMAALCDETMRALLQKSERFSYLYGRNLDEVLEVVLDLGRELRLSHFEPAGFEVEFSAAGQMPPISVQGETAQAMVSGFVDRVDLFTAGAASYVRVVDYKTGKKSFDYTDVLNGMGLQMLIYLFALEDGGEQLFAKKLRPAGVLYFPARRPILSATGKMTPEAAALKHLSEQTRKGLLLQDEQVLTAMEEYEKSPRYLPFKVTAKGELTGDLADRAQLVQLRAHVERMLRQITDAIAQGEVTPNPIVRGAESTACAYCDFAQICHLSSGEVAERPMARTGRDEFWEKIEQEAQGHG